MSGKERSAKDRTPNVKEKRKGKDKSAMPALLLFGNDVSADDIVDAIRAESRRQVAAGKTGRRLVTVKRNG
jgi:hypothetical protein